MKSQQHAAAVGGVGGARLGAEPGQGLVAAVAAHRRLAVAEELVLEDRLLDLDVGVAGEVLEEVDVEEDGLDQVASARPPHLAAVLPARLAVEHAAVERRVELGDALGGENGAALDVELAGDLDAVEVDLAVATDLIRAVALLGRAGGLPVAGVDDLGLAADAAREGEVGLEDRPRVADRALAGVHQPRGRRGVGAEAALEQGVLDGERAEGAGVEAARPVVGEDGAEGRRGACASRGTAGRRGSASP